MRDKKYNKTNGQNEEVKGKSSKREGNQNRSDERDSRLEEWNGMSRSDKNQHQSIHIALDSDP